jgi:hypothetical protein
MDVLSVRTKVEDRVADQLTGSVIRHVATAACFVNGHAAPGELFIRGENIGAAAAANANRQDVRMFEQQQRIGDAAGPTLFDQVTLQLQRFVVCHPTGTKDVEWPQG